MNMSKEPSSVVPTTQFLSTSAGHEIATYDYGGSGPTVLFAHGASFLGQIWNEVAYQLGSSFRCISFDFYGHGQSSGSATKPSDKGITWPELFLDIGEILDAFNNGEPMYGVGHSLGGVGLVSAQLKQPSLFSAIWTYEPIIFQRDHRFQAICETMANTAVQRRPNFTDRDEAVRVLGARPTFAKVDPKVLTDYAEHGFFDSPSGIELRCMPTIEAMTYRAGADFELGNGIASLTVPVSFGFGSLNPNAAVQSRKLSSQVELGHSQAFDGLGHLGPLESPGAMAAHLSEFLRQP